MDSSEMKAPAIEEVKPVDAAETLETSDVPAELVTAMKQIEEKVVVQLQQAEAELTDKEVVMAQAA